MPNPTITVQVLTATLAIALGGALLWAKWVTFFSLHPDAAWWAFFVL
jgi:hypothetical protein